MDKRLRIVIGIVVFISFLTFVVISNSQEQNETKRLMKSADAISKYAEIIVNANEQKTGTPLQNTLWRQVKSWQGSEAKKTESFKITGKQWRIRWSNKDTTGKGYFKLSYGIFQVLVYRAGKETPEQIYISFMGTKTDTTYVYEAGEYYLDINPIIATKGNWEISIEEAE
jgi:hypothetical protein